MDERQASEVMRLAREKVIATAQSDRAIAAALRQVTENAQENAFTDLFQNIAAERQRMLGFYLYSTGGIDGAIRPCINFWTYQLA